MNNTNTELNKAEKYHPSIKHPFSDEEIARRARKAGVMNHPSSLDAEMDVNEKEFTAFFRNLVDEERAKLNNKLADIRREKDVLIHKTSSEGDANKVLEKECEIDQKLVSIQAVNMEQIEKLKEEVDYSHRRFRYFQSENNLEAVEPQKESAIRHWGLLGLMVVSEWVALSYFYGQTSNYGLAGGFMTAGMIGLPIAIFAWMIGNAIKKFSSKSAPERFINISVAIVLFGFLVTSILFSGHLRYAASLITQQALLGNSVEISTLGSTTKQQIISSPEIDETFLASQLAWENILNNGAFVADVMSWLLMFASAAFSILLIKKTYAYLGSENQYWSLYESWKNKELALENAKLTYLSDVDGVYSKQSLAIKKIADDVESRIAQLQTMWDDYHAQLEKFEHYVAEVEGACNRSLAKYRSINRAIATTQAPKHFESKFSVPESPSIKADFAAANNQTGIEVIKPKVATLKAYVKGVMEQIDKKREEKLGAISNSIYQQLQAA